MAMDAMTVMEGYRSGLDAHDHPANRQFMVEVFRWMTGGLVLSGVVAAWLCGNPEKLRAFFQGGSLLLVGLCVVELVMVVVLSAGIQKLSFGQAAGGFLFFAALNGVTLAPVLLVYTQASVSNAFFTTAGVFGVMSAYGYVTKTDLTTMGNLLFMALIGIVIASFVNFFMRSPAVSWATTYAGVLVFVGLTAYDTQKIKKLDFLVRPGSEEEEKEAILGALSLYLDFVNLFLDILRIMGRRR